MSATRQTVDTLLSRIVACAAPEQVAELYADQVDWPSSEHLDVPWIRPRSTRADVADHHRTLAAASVPGQAEATVTGILVDGPDAVVFG
ncbi:hypothetical protein AB0875_07745 [Micromonospora gifhornensis]|uniref:hypothetical protein n=1 Tax=Micromonospora gifhornensis TaxID=84594 RepID=UPI0034550384